MDTAVAELSQPTTFGESSLPTVCVNGSTNVAAVEDKSSCRNRAQSYRRKAMGDLLTAASNGGLRAEFDDDVWLTPMEIASKFEYTTTQPILKAIRRGELTAHHSPCGRKLLIRPADYVRWRDEELRYTPPVGKNTSARICPPNGTPTKPRRSMPTLNYTDQEQR